MTRLPDQFVEDLALRNAARSVFMADIEHARTNISAKGAATRVATRIGDGAKDVIEVAKVQADDNRGVIAILIGAIIVWFTRQPLLELLGILDSPADTEGTDGESREFATDPDAPTETENDVADQGPEQRPNPTNDASIPAGDDHE